AGGRAESRRAVPAPAAASAAGSPERRTRRRRLRRQAAYASAEPRSGRPPGDEPRRPLRARGAGLAAARRARAGVRSRQRRRHGRRNRVRRRARHAFRARSRADRRVGARVRVSRRGGRARARRVRAAVSRSDRRGRPHVSDRDRAQSVSVSDRRVPGLRVESTVHAADEARHSRADGVFMARQGQALTPLCRWALLGAAIVGLGSTADAAEPALAIELPDVELVLPSVSPPHFQREGVPYATESELVTDLLTLVGSADYEAALALAKEKHATEVALLESGDPAGILSARVGPGRLPVPVPSGGNRISATVLYLVGHIYMTLERYVPAEAAFKAALVPLPDYLRVHEALGLLYLRTERYDE